MGHDVAFEGFDGWTADDDGSVFLYFGYFGERFVERYDAAGEVVVGGFIVPVGWAEEGFDDAYFGFAKRAWLSVGVDER